MASDSLERRLTAVLSADAVGYSRLMGEDDEATVRTLQAHRGRIERVVDTFRGRVVDSPGDNLLAEFPSAIGSVRCALEIQRALALENAKLAADRRMPYRIGIHLGDVVVEGPRIHGDGVNVAARLEGLAAPGAICLSDAVYQQVRRRLELPAADLGEQKLKNIEGAVRVYQIVTEPGASQRPPARAIASASVARTPPDKPSLAVLPFANLNGDPTQEHFSDGLTVDIMAELVRIPGLFLIGQDSVFTYKDTAARPREVARELGVRHVLEGAVRRDDRRVRVTARLVEGSSGRYVWAERYDRELEDVFAVQDEITEHVVTELDVTLVGGENARSIRQHVRTPQALGLLYRGLELLHRFTQEDMERARCLFDEVVRLEPESPIPYAELAWTHYLDVERGWSEAPAESLARMEELSHQSLERGDVSGYAHLMLGHMHLMKREHDEALARGDRALEERPSCQAAWGLKANILNFCGQPEEATPLAQQSLRLSPVAQTFFPEVLATAHYLCGRLEAAITAAHETLALAPDSVDARVVLAASFVETGRLQAAQQAVHEVLSIDPRLTLERFAASRPYRDPAVLERLLDALRRAGLPAGVGSGSGALAQPWAAARRRVAPRPRR
jgi:TolB-like protein/Flp pilus assembly protein TadD